MPTLREFLTGAAAKESSTTLSKKIKEALAKEMSNLNEPTKTEHIMLANAFLQNLLEKKIADDNIIIGVKDSKEEDFIKIVVGIAKNTYAVQKKHPKDDEASIAYALGEYSRNSKTNLRRFFATDGRLTERVIDTKNAAASAAIKILKIPLESKKEEEQIKELLDFVNSNEKLFMLQKALLTAAGITLSKDRPLSDDEIKKMTEILRRNLNLEQTPITDMIISNHKANLESLSKSLTSNKDKAWPEKSLTTTLEIFCMEHLNIEVLCTLAYGGPYLLDLDPPSKTTVKDEKAILERGEKVFKEARNLAKIFAQEKIQIDGTPRFIHQDQPGGILYGQTVKTLRNITLENIDRYPDADKKSALEAKKTDKSTSFAWGSKDHFHWTFSSQEIHSPIQKLTDDFNRIKNSYTLDDVIENLKIIGITLTPKGFRDDLEIANRILLENHLRRFSTLVQDSKEVLSDPQIIEIRTYLAKEWDNIIDRSYGDPTKIINQFNKVKADDSVSFRVAFQEIGGKLTRMSTATHHPAVKRPPAAPRQLAPKPIKEIVKDFFTSQQIALSANNKNILSNLKTNLAGARHPQTLSEFFMLLIGLKEQGTHEKNIAQIKEMVLATNSKTNPTISDDSATNMATQWMPIQRWSFSAADIARGEIDAAIREFEEQERKEQIRIKLIDEAKISHKLKKGSITTENLVRDATLPPTVETKVLIGNAAIIAEFKNLISDLAKIKLDATSTIEYAEGILQEAEIVSLQDSKLDNLKTKLNLILEKDLPIINDNDGEKIIQSKIYAARQLISEISSNEKFVIDRTDIVARMIAMEHSYNTLANEVYNNLTSITGDQKTNKNITDEDRADLRKFLLDNKRILDATFGKALPMLDGIKPNPVAIAEKLHRIIQADTMDSANKLLSSAFKFGGDTRRDQFIQGIKELNFSKKLYPLRIKRTPEEITSQITEFLWNQRNIVGKLKSRPYVEDKKNPPLTSFFVSLTQDPKTTTSGKSTAQLLSDKIKDQNFGANFIDEKTISPIMGAAWDTIGWDSINQQYSPDQREGFIVNALNEFEKRKKAEASLSHKEAVSVFEGIAALGNPDKIIQENTQFFEDADKYKINIDELSTEIARLGATIIESASLPEFSLLAMDNAANVLQKVSDVIKFTSTIDSRIQQIDILFAALREKIDNKKMAEEEQAKLDAISKSTDVSRVAVQPKEGDLQAVIDQAVATAALEIKQLNLNPEDEKSCLDTLNLTKNYGSKFIDLTLDEIPRFQEAIESRIKIPQADIDFLTGLDPIDNYITTNSFIGEIDTILTQAKNVKDAKNAADSSKVRALHQAAVENLDKTITSATSITDKTHDELLSDAASFNIDIDKIAKLKGELLSLISDGETLDERKIAQSDDATSISGKVVTINFLATEISSAAKQLDELTQKLVNEIAQAAEDKAQQDTKGASIKLDAFKIENDPSHFLEPEIKSSPFSLLRKDPIINVTKSTIISPSNKTQARAKEAKAKSDLDSEIGMDLTLLTANSLIKEADNLGIRDPSLVVLRRLTGALATLHQSKTELAPKDASAFAIIQHTQKFEALTAQIKSQKKYVLENMTGLKQAVDTAKDKLRNSALAIYTDRIDALEKAKIAAGLIINKIDSLPSDPIGKIKPLKELQIKLQELLDTSLTDFMLYDDTSPEMILEKANGIRALTALLITQTDNTDLTLAQLTILDLPEATELFNNALSILADAKRIAKSTIEGIPFDLKESGVEDDAIKKIADLKKIIITESEDESLYYIDEGDSVSAILDKARAMKLKAGKLLDAASQIDNLVKLSLPIPEFKKAIITDKPEKSSGTAVPTPTREIKFPEPSVPSSDKTDRTSHAFASLPEVTTFIEDARELLEDIKKRHRSHGHIKQYKSGYEQVSKIIANLKLAEKYLNTFPDDADGKLKELQDNLTKLITFATKLDTGIKKLQTVIDTKGALAEKIIPSFGDKYRKIEVKPGEDFITIAKKSEGIPDPTQEPRSLLTLSAAAGEEFKHWTGISGDKAAYVHTLEDVGTYADGVDTYTDQYIAAVIQLADELKVEGIFKLFFLPATPAFPENRIEEFCEELARYLNKNKLHPDDPKGIAEFLKSPECHNLTPAPPAFPKDIEVKLAEHYKKAVIQDTYRDKTRALAASIVNRFLANKRDLTSEPLRITSAFSPEIAKEVMIICELRNSRDPDHKIDYRNNTGYEKIPRPTPAEVQDLATRLDTLARLKDDKNPLCRFLNKLIPHDETKTEKHHVDEQARHKVGRAAPDIGFFNTKVKKVEIAARKIEDSLAKHDRKKS